MAKAKYYFTYDMLDKLEFCNDGKMAYKDAFPERALINRKTVKDAYNKDFRNFRNLALQVAAVVLDKDLCDELYYRLHAIYVALLVGVDHKKLYESLSNYEADEVVRLTNEVGDIIVELKALNAL